MAVVSFRNFAFGCVLLLAIQQVALAVTCYSCAACSSVSSSTATATDNYCYKAVASTSGVTVINRGAIPSSLTGSQTIAGVSYSYYSCSTDYCNGSSTLSSSLALAFALAVTAFFAGNW